jgi:Protein of unknown function (DUF4038)/Putative collagen-binding domain of a collagenase
MSRSHRTNWQWLALALLAAVTFSFLAAKFVRHRKQQLETQAFRFQVAAVDNLVANPTTERARVPNPGRQLMTLDPAGKYLINSISNKPVFLTGDDAWSLQVQLSEEDIRYYLDDRASRGFNALWVGLVDNTYSNHPPRDFYGNVPFDGPDFTNENPAYWRRVDQTLREAAARGITVFASPAFVGAGCDGGYCKSYRSSSLGVVASYGEFLGKRYRDFPNVVWLIGGDADPFDKNVQSKLYALAQGIRSADPMHLITTENNRGTSSIGIWSEAKWLDLDALYVEPRDIPHKAKIDYLIGTHPLFLLEDWYEGEHGISELEVREEGYWAVLSGCTLGRFFGNYATWNFSWQKNTTDSWKDQLGSKGSIGQAWMGRLFRSRAHWKLVPDFDHNVVTSGNVLWKSISSVSESIERIVSKAPAAAPRTLSVAAQTSDGQTIIVYVPNGNAESIGISMDRIRDPESQTRAWWFNPRDGSTWLIGTFASSGRRKFTAPDSSDWVLVIDSLSANLPPPGSRDFR